MDALRPLPPPDDPDVRERMLQALREGRHEEFLRLSDMDLAAERSRLAWFRENWRDVDWSP